MINTLKVYLYGMQMGTLLLGSDGYCTFQYTDTFCRTGLKPAPLTMPAIPSNTYRFPILSRDTFNGLPGMIADALPDSFGQALLNRWLTFNGRSEGNANVIEKLSFQGKRCMGALEFVPSRESYLEESSAIELDELIETAARILSDKESFKTSLQNNEKAILDILKIGTSAGGQRAKAIIAMNENTGEIRSGQVAAPDGFDYWLLKFDGFDSNARPVTPANFGRREYAFAQCVRDAGISMTQCRLLEENGRAHFLTRRFDRVNGQKIHMQTLCGLAHLDFRMPGAHSYEQAFMVMRRLGLTYKEGQDMFRRIVFNVMSVNMDDHTKNISFLMTGQGRWLLSPAYDMGFSYNPNGMWANAHQMTINGKRDEITRQDLLKVAETQDIRNPKELIEQVEYGISKFESYAIGCGIPHPEISAIKRIMNEKNPFKQTIISINNPVPKEKNTSQKIDTPTKKKED